MLTKGELQEYRRNRVTMVVALCDIIEDSIADIPYTGELPAYPELYEKEDWEVLGESIEHVVDKIKYEIQQIIDTKDLTQEERSILKGIIAILYKVDWEEI